MRLKLLSSAACLTAAIIWGFAFSMQDYANRTLDPFSINMIRTYMATLALIPVVIAFDRISRNGRKLFSRDNKHLFGFTKKEVVGGFCCGFALAVASCLQQWGLAMPGTTAGSTAFITALYVVIVPVFARVLGRRQPFFVWISVLVATGGFYLMNMTDGGFSPSFGALLVLGSAITYACHVLTIDHFVEGSDPIRLSMVQFFSCATILLPISLFIGRPTFEGFVIAFPYVLYLGVLSCGVAFTLQVVGQKYAAPAIACLLLSLESVFGAVGGALILGERMGIFEILGAATVFGAILFSQIADILREKMRQKHLREIGEDSII